MYKFTGWKLHLNVTQSQGESIPKWLGTRYLHKVGWSGDQPGKGMTIYVGAYQEALRLAVELSAKYCLGPAAGDVLIDDKQIYKNVWGRFDVNDPEWHQYGKSGVSLTNLQAAQLFGVGGDTRTKMVEAFIASNHLVLQRKYPGFYQ
jgi:hypothetical protein